MINSNKIINKIQEIRSKNNVNWMDLLRLAFKNAPDEAKTDMPTKSDVRRRGDFTPSIF